MSYQQFTAVTGCTTDGWLPAWEAPSGTFLPHSHCFPQLANYCAASDDGCHPLVTRTAQSDLQTLHGQGRLSPSAAKLRLLKSLRCTLRYEKEAWRNGAHLVGGVDEAGRGCLFGPVVAAAVILNPERRIRGLRDSKLLPEETRERLAAEIRKHAICWAFASVDAAQIDVINILQASRLAMRNAVLQLRPEPDFLLIDAIHLDHACAQRAIIHGDALSVSIAAASIIAKVERDRMMRELDATYPQYALASNKGYGTPAHRAALLEHGPTPLHRMTFAPVRSAQEEFEFPDDFDDIAEEAADESELTA